jgi:hypothetical protein
MLDASSPGSPNMARMPSLLRPAVRLLLAVAFAVLAPPAASALAQAGVSVTIEPPGGAAPQTISTADIPNGDMSTTYKVGAQKIVVDGGVSIYQLLDKANANFDYAEIEIPRPDGSTLRLTKDQVEDTKPPGFYTDDQGVTHFIGPTASNGSVATKDYFTVGATITLTQQRESRLKVTISPSKKKIEVGGSVAFRAQVTGDEGGESVTYTWGLKGKKQTQAGPTFTQKFPTKDGVYQFLVAVRIEGSSISETAVATITVGDPKKSKDGQTGGGDAADGGDTGSTTGSGGSSSGSGSTYTPSYTPSTPASPPVTPTTPTRPSTPSAKPPQPPDIATSGTPVEGNLLADVSDPPPSSILDSAARAAREGRQKDESAADGADVSEAALSIVGVLALLALGAGIETRQGRLPRLRLPRRAA